MRLGLWAAVLLLASGTVSAEDVRMESDYWRDAKVSPAYARKFVNNTRCYTTPRYLLSCIRAVNTAGMLFSPPRQLNAQGQLEAVPPQADEVTWEAVYAVKRQKASALHAFSSTHIESALAGRTERLNFEALLNSLAKELPAGVAPAMFWAHAIAGHLQVFDPHANLLPLSLIENRQHRSQKRFVGIGINLDFVSAGVLVHEVFENSPAAEAGVREDDRVIEIAPDGENFVPVAGRSPDSMHELLPGADGSPIALKILRGDEQMIFHMNRGPVRIRSVKGHLAGGIGYIRLRSFESLEVCSAVKEQIEKLTADGAKSLILDLRGNAGGEASMAVCVAGLFLGRETVVGTQAKEYSIPSRPSSSHAFFTQNEEVIWQKAEEDRVTDLPLVVLANALSQSASEVVAGALQDHGRAWIVGERTAGKASMQAWRVPYDNPGIVIARTEALLYLPGGRSPQGTGVFPNFDVPLRRGASQADRFYPREADLYPGSGEAAPLPLWQDPRAAEAEQLESCVENSGLEGRLLKSFGDGRPDYQRAYALAVLQCL